MRILILANKMPFPPKDGGTIATLSLAEALCDSGCEVDLLAMNTHKHFCKIEDIPQSLRSKINFYTVAVDTRLKPVKALSNLLFSRLPYNAERFVSEEFMQQLASLLQQNAYDIVQLEGLYLCPYVPQIRKFSQAKISLRTHNVEHEIWQRMVVNEENFLKKWYKNIIAKRLQKMELSAINSYDCLVPITMRDADFFVKHGNTKPFYVAPTGISHTNPLFSLDITQAEFPGFFYLGALDWQPNIEGLTWFVSNVWNDYKVKHRDARMYVAGRRASNEFAQFLRDGGIDFLGEIDSVEAFYKRVSIFVIPLFSGSGMRVKLIEGMSAGKSIITTSIGTEGVDTVDSENIIIANNADEFVAAMEKLASDREYCVRLAEAARKFVVENFDNQTIGERLKEFYGECIIMLF